MSLEASTRGTCRHTKHGHGWWCLRCLKKAAVRGTEERLTPGEWEVRIGPVRGIGPRVLAWQRAIERCEMDGVSLTEALS